MHTQVEGYSMYILCICVCLCLIFNHKNILSFNFLFLGNNFEWINLVTKELKGWQKLIEFWLEWGQNHPLLVVQYEDLVNNTSREIDVMLRFIGIQISLEDIRQKLRVQFK